MCSQVRNMGIALELVEMQNFSSHLRTTESESHCNKILRSFVCRLKFKRHYQKNIGAGEKTQKMGYLTKQIAKWSYAKAQFGGLEKM